MMLGGILMSMASECDPHVSVTNIYRGAISLLVDLCTWPRSIDPYVSVTMPHYLYWVGYINYPFIQVWYL